MPNLILVCCLRLVWPMSNTYLCYCLGCFAGIMGDFSWRPLVKHFGPTGGSEIVLPFATAPSTGERVNLLERLTLLLLLLRSP